MRRDEEHAPADSVQETSALFVEAMVRPLQETVAHPRDLLEDPWKATGVQDKGRASSSSLYIRNPSKAASQFRTAAIHQGPDRAAPKNSQNHTNT